MFWDILFVCFPFLSWVLTTVLLLLTLPVLVLSLVFSLQTTLFVHGSKRRVLLTFPVCCSVSSSQCGMKFVVCSIPETNRQQPCEVNKDVLKTLLYKWRNQGKRLFA